MERTRDEVVRILHDRGASSVAEVAEAVGVSAGAARRHLDLMIAEGLVEQRLERQPRGRPVTRYFLSDEGEERSASAHYHRLLGRIYPALSRLSEAAVSGKDGRAVLATMFEGVADEIARSYAGRVQGAVLDQRVAEVANALKEEGILSDVVDEPDQFRLRNLACPYRSTGEGAHAACAADRRTIELLLGESVEQVMTIVEGSPTCEYLVSKVIDEPVRGASDATRVGGQDHR